MDLLNQILSKGNLRQAYWQVVRNNGSPGIDGMDVLFLNQHLNKEWERIRTEIESGKHTPQAVKGIKIPKRSGGERLLGIPTVLDRMIQQAIHQALSPLWESDFSDFSYGFRPGRNAQQCVQQAQRYINEGYQDIIDLDLKSFFDVVNQDFLMSLLHRKIAKPAPISRGWFGATHALKIICESKYRLQYR